VFRVYRDAIGERRLPMNELFLIWSIEHDAWWRPNWLGYSRVLADAGLYPREEAERIVRGANIVAFHECMIPVRCVDAGEPRVEPPLCV
jgi:hypothetical protein